MEAIGMNNRIDSKAVQEPKSIWDNNLPAGNSPPLPKAPLVAASIAYGCWLLFLLSMVILRVASKT
jgi:hypothetical protein